jgi:hypothetical protein
LARLGTVGYAAVTGREVGHDRDDHANGVGCGGFASCGGSQPRRVGISAGAGADAGGLQPASSGASGRDGSVDVARSGASLQHDQPGGLTQRPHSSASSRKLSTEQETIVSAWVRVGLKLDQHKITQWCLADLGDEIAR